MKKHYFFVTANVKFVKQYINHQYDRDQSDHHAFILREIFMVEQPTEETDDSFYVKLTDKIRTILERRMDFRVEEMNKNIPKKNGWSWKKDLRELVNISRVS